MLGYSFFTTIHYEVDILILV